MWLAERCWAGRSRGGGTRARATSASCNVCAAADRPSLRWRARALHSLLFVPACHIHTHSFNVQITHGERRRHTRARQRDRAGRVRGRRRAPPPLAPRPNHRCSLERSKGKRTHLGGSPRGSKTRGWGETPTISESSGFQQPKAGGAIRCAHKREHAARQLRLQRSLVTTCPHKETQQRQSRRAAPHNSALATKRDRGA